MEGPPTKLFLRKQFLRPFWTSWNHTKAKKFKSFCDANLFPYDFVTSATFSLH